MKENIQKTKEKIITALEGKNIVEIKVSFKGRWELFLMGWKLTRNFPTYSFKKELKKLIFPRKLEVMIK